MGWSGTDEYVRTMVPNIGYAGVAEAMGVNERWLRMKWPNLRDGNGWNPMRAYSTSDNAVRKRLRDARKSGL